MLNNIDFNWLFGIISYLFILISIITILSVTVYNLIKNKNNQEDDF